ncbi:hypothetical protein TCE0_033f08517 [Talaromyces pinophilus]|jgi:hypothetical protein|uniref:CCHC-type domain-containing protein n=1 Tax=Talaromyces pinophilus TaxID=128442 RepID=A0A6V8H9M1_TALPI|nr:hypothetical protein TCE0_033f08517 [Talaromyces pinophilus]
MSAQVSNASAGVDSGRQAAAASSASGGRKDDKRDGRQPRKWRVAKPQPAKLCYICRKPGHLQKNCPMLQAFATILTTLVQFPPNSFSVDEIVVLTSLFTSKSNSILRPLAKPRAFPTAPIIGPIVMVSVVPAVTDSVVKRMWRPRERTSQILVVRTEQNSSETSMTSTSSMASRVVECIGQMQIPMGEKEAPKHLN